jgi:peptidoglycan/LPS O-acetylase OafA/YrhL
MKYFVLSACITIAFFFFTSEKAFSITDQEQQMDTTSIESDETSPYAQGLTAGRAKSLVGGVLGLISLIIGWRAKARVAISHSARSWATTALVLGLVAIGLSVVHLANVSGGFGTGGGKAGAIVALVLGLIGIALSGLALRRKENRKT